jgi:hypothetical protein
MLLCFLPDEFGDSPYFQMISPPFHTYKKLHLVLGFAFVSSGSFFTFSWVQWGADSKLGCQQNPCSCGTLLQVGL